MVDSLGEEKGNQRDLHKGGEVDEADGEIVMDKCDRIQWQLGHRQDN